MLMDGAQVEQAAHPVEKHCQINHHFASGALASHPADPLAQEQSRDAQESYRSQVSQARDNPKQNLAPQKEAIKNWESWELERWLSG